MKNLFNYVAVLLSAMIIFLPQATFAKNEEQIVNEMLQDEVTTPTQINQLLIAYCASKDLRFIDKLIHTYADIANDPSIDVNDIFMMSQSIGIPEYREKTSTKLTASLKKYKNIDDLQKIMLASNTLWCLYSGAKELSLVNQHIQKYILNARNKKATIPLQKMLKMINQ